MIRKQVFHSTQNLKVSCYDFLTTGGGGITFWRTKNIFLENSLNYVTKTMGPLSDCPLEIEVLLNMQRALLENIVG